MIAQYDITQFFKSMFKKHLKQYVHLSDINLNNFQNSGFSEYSHLVIPTVQKCSVKILFHRKTPVAEL